MKVFAPNLTDFYKVSHKFMFPEGTQYVYSNLTCRSDKLAKVLPDFDHKVVFFGLQAVCKWLLIDLWNETFFNIPKEEAIAKYKKRMDSSLGVGAVPTEHIEALHDLGYLPVLIKALPEGSRVNMRVPVFTIVNTNPDFYWVTNYLETQLSAELWKPITSATTAFEYRRLFERYALETGANKDFIQWQGHDFSFRGMSGHQDAITSGAGHLLSFTGTDTIPAIDYLEEYYFSKDELIGASVPASEHSVVMMGGMRNELDTFYDLLKKYPKGVLSLVSDTWDYFQVLTEYAVTLKNEILSRNGKLVFRPDCYSEDTKILTQKGWKYFTEIDENTPVAQVLEDGSYEFVKPLKYIEQEYEGDMCEFSDHHGKVNLLVTPNHRMIFKQNGVLKTQLAEKAPSNGYFGKNIVRTARAKNKGRSLTPLERIKIAFQADGSYCTGMTSAIRFSFSKKRKIARLKKLAEDANIPYEVYNLSDGRVEIHLKIFSHFFFKNFSWVDISDLCSNWSEEFMEELSHWDSSIRNSGRFKFDTTVEEVMTVVELIAIAAGKGILISKASDDRKDIFSDVYTAHIMKKNTIGGQAWTKNTVKYKGHVYCVTVPSGMLLVKRGRGTAVCGNSGDPVKIIVGDPEAIPGTPEFKGSVECLWEVFGGTITSEGYKTLDSHVGLIYGDSITLDRAQRILQGLKDKGFSSDNIVFGIGSFTYTFCTRDSFGSAVKATWGVVNGEDRELFKDPKTDNGIKKSAKGLLRVEKEGNDFILYDQQTREQEKQGALRTVFYDGKVYNLEALHTIRERLLNEI